jgi:hypothetical protein
LNIQDIIQEQRSSEEFADAMQTVIDKLRRSEEQIKKIETYIKLQEKALITEYAQMVEYAQKHDTAIPFYDIWTLAKADEALFS